MPLGIERDDVDLVLQDHGITLPPHDTIVYVYAGSGPSEDTGQSPSNPHGIVAHASLCGGMITVCEDVGLRTFAHELGHNLCMVDLYDNDDYNAVLNGSPPNPPPFMCNAFTPYSLMSGGGMRVDAIRTNIG